MSKFSSSRTSLSVLMIGNSFSICTGRYLPQMVATFPGKSLTLTSLYIGGCSLEQHLDNIEEAETDPDYTPYKLTTWSSGKGVVREGVSSVQRELNKDLDIITLQQCSPRSWNQATYRPFLDKIITFIRKRVPKAEICLQQTWAYRSSSPHIAPGNPIWGFGQQEMYERLTAAYCTEAKRFGLRMIPTGAAVQETRSGQTIAYPNSDTVNSMGFQWPDLPQWSGDVVGALSWFKDETGKLKIKSDDIHLNVRGEYLQACVWCSFLFNVDPEKITFVPDELDNDDAAFLRGCAKRALTAFPPGSK
jgi:hypothetical protein